VDCYAADIRLGLSGVVHRTSTGQSRPLTAGAQGLVPALYGIFVQHFRVPVDHKRFRMARRSTAHEVIRAVCPQCKSPKEKKNGRILLVILFPSYMATMTTL